jgi:hypothetical protein
MLGTSPKIRRLALALTALGLAGTGGTAGLEGALHASTHVAAPPARAGAAGGTGTARAGTAISALARYPVDQAGYALAPGPRPEAPAVGSAQPAGFAERVRETGNATVVVAARSLQRDLQALATLATADGGFVASTTTQAAAAGSPAQGTVVLEVPYGRFGATVAAVRALGEVSSLTTSAQDVTDQYNGLQAQLASLEASRRQYLAIMARATTIGSVLAVQDQLDAVQAQLAQLHGQLASMANQTTYSALTITLTAHFVPPAAPRPPSGWARAWNGAVAGFVAGCQAALRATGPLAFAALLAGTLLLGLRGAVRAWRRRGPRAAASNG